MNILRKFWQCQNIFYLYMYTRIRFLVCSSILFELNQIAENYIHIEQKRTNIRQYLI